MYWHNVELYLEPLKLLKILSLFYSYIFYIFIFKKTSKTNTVLKALKTERRPFYILPQILIALFFNWFLITG